MRVYMKEKKQAPPQKELAGSLSTLKKRVKTQEKIRVHANATPPLPGDTDEDEDGDEDEDKEEDEEEDEEEEEKEDNFSAKSLSLAKSAKPLSDPEEASKTTDRLARFTLLNRLDLSHAGLKSTELLAEAVNASQKESAKRPAGAREWFGRRLTWLSMAGNAGLGEELAASSTKEPVKGKGKGKAKQSPSVWSGLELMQELFVLNLSHCALPSPPPIASLPNLRALILSHNNLSFLAQSSSFPLLPHLNTLVLSHNSLKSLPTTLPSSCPSLTKLSITFNDLGPSPESKNSRTLTILPDFTPLLSLREVRLGHNPRLAQINLPAHIATWGTGTDGSGKGLTVLELNSCGIDDWKKLGPLLKVDKAQNQEGDRRGGLAVLNLKDNPVCELDGYRKKILAVHRNLRSLDDVRIESNVPKKETPKSRNASRPAPSTDANAEPVSARTKRKREDVDEEAVDTPSDSDPAATKKRTDATKKEEKAGKSAALKKEGTHEESAGKKRKHLKEDTKSSEQESQTPPEANAADTSKKGARRGSRGGAKKSNMQEPSPEKMDVDAVETADASTSVGDVSKQPATEDGTAEPGAPKKKRKKAKKETAAASDVSGDDQTPSTSANPLVKKEPKEKKLRQRQAKKLQPAVAWDAEPAGIKEEVIAGTSQAAEQSAGQKAEDEVKQKTSVVGVIEVKKRNKTKREEGAAPASAASGSGSAVAPEVAAALAVSGGAGADEIGTGKSEDAWGGGGDGFW
ncbi:hypothetical protein CF319_g2921 [Tilletia indica]|nr:hypothetical protein CF319_g2921 [Tilletia indica]